jgi:hypothetical protein
MRNEQRAKLRYYPFPLLFVICYLLFACKSEPKAPDRTLLESGVVPLDKGAAAYALIDVARARPIMEGISYIPLNDKNMKQMLDRTRSAAVAVFTPSPEDDRRFQLVSWGNYPASGASMAFGTNKAWKKQKSASLNTVYWHSEKAQMSVAVGSSQAFVLVAMTKIPHDPIPSPEGIKIPDGFGEFARDAVFSCWLPDPGPSLNQKLKGMGLPLEIPAEQFFISMFPHDDQASASRPSSSAEPSSPAETLYEAHIKIKLPGETQARAIVALLSLARTFIPPIQLPSPAESSDSQEILAQKSAAMMVYILFANPIVQEGDSLIIKTPPLNARDISLLFSMFSL